MKTSTRTEAKRAFVLADRLKVGPFDCLESLKRSWTVERSKVQQLFDADLDRIIAPDPKRLGEYDRASWKLDRIMLAQCFVYPKMGERPWAEGTVENVAEEFKTKEPPDSRIWKMMPFSSFFEAQLHILVLKEKSHCRIDDGCHRAIAMSLSGIKQITAWVGNLMTGPSS